jgi:hypothetical protein
MHPKKPNYPHPSQTNCTPLYFALASPDAFDAVDRTKAVLEEEEAQRARRRGRVRTLLGRDDVRHDALRARAAVAVVVGRQPGRGGGEDEEEEGCEGEDVAAAQQRADC